MRIGLESFYRVAGSNDGLANLVAGANAGSKEANNCLVRGQLLEGIRDSLVYNGLMTQSRDVLGRERITWSSDKVEKFFRKAEACLYGDDNGAVRDDVSTADLDGKTVKELLDDLVELQGRGKPFAGFSNGALGPNEERILKEIARWPAASKHMGLGFGSDGMEHVKGRSDLAGSNALRERILQIAKNASASGEPKPNWCASVADRLGIPAGKTAADCKKPLTSEDLAEVIKLFEEKYGAADTWGEPMPQQDPLTAPGVTDRQRDALRNLDRPNLCNCLDIDPEIAKGLSVDTVEPLGENGLLKCVLRSPDGKTWKVLCDREGVVFSYEDYKKAMEVLCCASIPDEKFQKVLLAQAFIPIDFIDHREMANITRWLCLLDEGLKAVDGDTILVTGTFLAMLTPVLPKARAIQGGTGPIPLSTLARALHLEIKSYPITAASFAAAVCERIRTDAGYSYPALPDGNAGEKWVENFRFHINNSGLKYFETLLARRYKLGFSKDGAYLAYRDFKLPKEYGGLTAEGLKKEGRKWTWKKRTFGSQWCVGGEKMTLADDLTFDGIVDRLDEQGFKAQQTAALLRMPHLFFLDDCNGFNGKDLVFPTSDAHITKDGDRMKAVYFFEWEPEAGESVPDHAKLMRYEALIDPDGHATCTDMRLVSEEQKADELANPEKALPPVPHFTSAQAETIVYSKGFENPRFDADGKTVLCDVSIPGQARRQVAILEDGSVEKRKLLSEEKRGEWNVPDMEDRFVEGAKFLRIVKDANALEDYEVEILESMLPAAEARIRQAKKTGPITLADWWTALGLDVEGRTPRPNVPTSVNSFVTAFRLRVADDFRAVLGRKNGDAVNVKELWNAMKPKPAGENQDPASRPPSYSACLRRLMVEERNLFATGPQPTPQQKAAFVDLKDKTLAVQLDIPESRLSGIAFGAPRMSKDGKFMECPVRFADGKEDCLLIGADGDYTSKSAYDEVEKLLREEFYQDRPEAQMAAFKLRELPAARHFLKLFLMAKPKESGWCVLHGAYLQIAYNLIRAAVSSVVEDHPDVAAADLLPALWAELGLKTKVPDKRGLNSETSQKFFDAVFELIGNGILEAFWLEDNDLARKYILSRNPDEWRKLEEKFSDTPMGQVIGSNCIGKGLPMGFMRANGLPFLQKVRIHSGKEPLKNGKYVLPDRVRCGVRIDSGQDEETLRNQAIKFLGFTSREYGARFRVNDRLLFIRTRKPVTADAENAVRVLKDEHRFTYKQMIQLGAYLDNLCEDMSTSFGAMSFPVGADLQITGTDEHGNMKVRAKVPLGMFNGYGDDGKVLFAAKKAYVHEFEIRPDGSETVGTVSIADNDSGADKVYEYDSTGLVQDKYVADVYGFATLPEDRDRLNALTLDETISYLKMISSQGKLLDNLEDVENALAGHLLVRVTELVEDRTKPARPDAQKAVDELKLLLARVREIRVAKPASETLANLGKSAAAITAGIAKLEKNLKSPDRKSGVVPAKPAKAVANPVAKPAEAPVAPEKAEAVASGEVAGPGVRIDPAKLANFLKVDEKAAGAYKVVDASPAVGDYVICILTDGTQPVKLVMSPDGEFASAADFGACRELLRPQESLISALSAKDLAETVRFLEYVKDLNLSSSEMALLKSMLPGALALLPKNKLSRESTKRNFRVTLRNRFETDYREAAGIAANESVRDKGDFASYCQGAETDGLSYSARLAKLKVERGFGQAEVVRQNPTGGIKAVNQPPAGALADEYTEPRLRALLTNAVGEDLVEDALSQIPAERFRIVGYLMKLVASANKKHEDATEGGLDCMAQGLHGSQLILQLILRALPDIAGKLKPGASDQEVLAAAWEVLGLKGQVPDVGSPDADGRFYGAIGLMLGDRFVEALGNENEAVLRNVIYNKTGGNFPASKVDAKECKNAYTRLVLNCMETRGLPFRQKLLFAKTGQVDDSDFKALLGHTKYKNCAIPEDRLTGAKNEFNTTRVSGVEFIVGNVPQKPRFVTNGGYGPTDIMDELVKEFTPEQIFQLAAFPNNSGEDAPYFLGTYPISHGVKIEVTGKDKAGRMLVKATYPLMAPKGSGKLKETDGKNSLLFKIMDRSLVCEFAIDKNGTGEYTDFRTEPNTSGSAGRTYRAHANGAPLDYNLEVEKSFAQRKLSLGQLLSINEKGTDRLQRLSTDQIKNGVKTLEGAKADGGIKDEFKGEKYLTPDKALKVLKRNYADVLFARVRNGIEPEAAGEKLTAVIRLNLSDGKIAEMTDAKVIGNGIRDVDNALLELESQAKEGDWATAAVVERLKGLKTSLENRLRQLRAEVLVEVDERRRKKEKYVSEWTLLDPPAVTASRSNQGTEDALARILGVSADELERMPIDAPVPSKIGKCMESRVTLPDGREDAILIGPNGDMCLKSDYEGVIAELERLGVHRAGEAFNAFRLRDMPAARYFLGLVNARGDAIPEEEIGYLDPRRVKAVALNMLLAYLPEVVDAHPADSPKDMFGELWSKMGLKGPVPRQDDSDQKAGADFYEAIFQYAGNSILEGLKLQNDENARNYLLVKSADYEVFSNPSTEDVMSTFARHLLEDYTGLPFDQKIKVLKGEKILLGDEKFPKKFVNVKYDTVPFGTVKDEADGFKAAVKAFPDDSRTEGARFRMDGKDVLVHGAGHLNAEGNPEAVNLVGVLKEKGFNYRQIHQLGKYLNNEGTWLMNRFGGSHSQCGCVVDVVGRDGDGNMVVRAKLPIKRISRIDETGKAFIVADKVIVHEFKIHDDGTGETTARSIEDNDEAVAKKEYPSETYRNDYLFDTFEIKKLKEKDIAGFDFEQLVTNLKLLAFFRKDNRFAHDAEKSIGKVERNLSAAIQRKMTAAVNKAQAEWTPAAAQKSSEILKRYRGILVECGKDLSDRPSGGDLAQTVKRLDAVINILDSYVSDGNLPWESFDVSNLPAKGAAEQVRKPKPQPQPRVVVQQAQPVASSVQKKPVRNVIGRGSGPLPAEESVEKAPQVFQWGIYNTEDGKTYRFMTYPQNGGNGNHCLFLSALRHANIVPSVEKAKNLRVELRGVFEKLQKKVDDCYLKNEKEKREWDFNECRVGKQVMKNKTTGYVYEEEPGTDIGLHELFDMENGVGGKKSALKYESEQMADVAHAALLVSYLKRPVVVVLVDHVDKRDGKENITGNFMKFSWDLLENKKLTGEPVYIRYESSPVGTTSRVGHFEAMKLIPAYPQT